MSNKKYDSEFCGSLPIHLINLIQPYGALLVVDENSNRIMQASENADAVFGIPVEKLINTSLDVYVTDMALEDLRQKATSDNHEKIPAIWQIKDKRFLVVVHRKGNALLIEIDLQQDQKLEQSSFVEVYQEIKYSMGLVQNTNTLEEVARIAARELKRISGFDKVMVYRFDGDWNGTVIAEEMEDGMESYYGFTFPASDIPEPARRLYLTNPYRFIPNREYTPVKIYPVINPLTQSFLDLSECNVRAVPSVHLEYLRNMGVMSSMSTRILVENKLWGLIACHHRSAKSVSFELRSIFELVSNLVSSKISSLQSTASHLMDSTLKENYKNIIESAYREDNLHLTLLNNNPDLLKLFNAQGAAITRKGKIYSKGVVPNDDHINELILWLHTKHLKAVFHTESISEQYDKGTDFRESASGVLVIPVDASDDEYVLIFRPQVIKTIKWGGDPNTRIQFDADQKNYHPRHSFQLWQQQVEGTSLPWREEEITVAENLRSFIYEFNN